MACILLLELCCESPWFSSIQEDGCDKGAHQTYLRTERNTPVIPNWFQLCQCCCCLCYPGEYLKLGTLISYNLTAELQRRIQAMEMRCYRKILRISYKDHVTYVEVGAKIQQAIRPHADLPTIIKRRKLQWYGHISRSSRIAKPILQGTVKRGRRQGGQRERREDIRELMDRPGVRQVPEGCGEQGKMQETGCEIICGAPTTLTATG